MVVFTCAMVLFTCVMVSFIRWSRSANPNPSRPAIVDSGAAGVARSVPAPISRNVPPTSPSVSIAATESVRTS